MEIYALLGLIAFFEFLQIPQTQKLLSWMWVQVKWICKRASMPVKRLSRRFYYWCKP